VREGARVVCDAEVGEREDACGRFFVRVLDLAAFHVVGVLRLFGSGVFGALIVSRVSVLRIAVIAVLLDLIRAKDLAVVPTGRVVAVVVTSAVTKPVIVAVVRAELLHRAC